MDQRGQISVEFVLFAAIVLVVVLAFALVISDQAEKNSVASAVKIGAENSTTQMSLLNRSMQPIRVTSINMTDTGVINIQVKFSGNVNANQALILGSINNALTTQGFTTGYSGGSLINMTTNKHNYVITIV
jgi:uncharacterized protein (UPF0333 family)